MPVSIPYTFTQTAECVDIVAHIHSGAVSKATVHLDCTPVYLKLNCTPSLLQLDLLHAVDADRVHMTLHEGARVDIRLHKAEPGVEWSALTADASLDKLARMQRRQASIAEREALVITRHAERLAGHKKQEKESLHSHWEIDRAQREAVLDIQNRERVNAVEELRVWKQGLAGAEPQVEETKSAHVEEVVDEEVSATAAEPALPDLDDGDDEDIAPASKKGIWDSSELEAATPVATAARPPAPAAAPVVLAPVRRGGKVEISFTKDATPMPSMPARESMMAQKMAYKATQGGLVPNADDPNATQHLPIFLKEKADKLFHDGDTLGAIAAYASALEGASKFTFNGAPTDPLLVARCHSNSAAAWLKLASGRTDADADTAALTSARTHMRKCAGDCSSAMAVLASGDFSEISVERLDADLLVLKNLQRRATAQAWLGAYQLAVADLNALLSKFTAAQKLHATLQRRRDDDLNSESKESEDSAAAASVPAQLPQMPTFDLAALAADRTLFSTLLEAFEAKQDQAYKSEGDRLISTASDSAAVTQAIAAYTQALLIHPGSLAALSNRMVARLRAGQWRDTLSDACLAVGLWEELWTVPRTGFSAVAPAAPSEGTHGLTPPSFSLAVAPRAAPVLAIASRVKLFMRRATARVALGQFLPAQADLQHALALAPLTAAAAPSSASAIQGELEFVAHRLSLARLKAKASLALQEARYRPAADQYTKCIESHNAWAASRTITTATEQAVAQAWTNTLLPSGGASLTLHAHHVSALSALLSDRALAHLQLRAYPAAIKDTSAALQVWEAQIKSELTSSIVYRQPSWVVPTLVRRGSARAFQGDWALAITDYEAALAAWPNAEDADERSKVVADLQRIREMAASQPK